jgi:raffinose/stachyose/melibiose transport system permease protein
VDLAVGAASDHCSAAAFDFVANGPLSLPQEWTLQNFADAWGVGNFATTYRNSAFLLILKVPLGVLISAMLAFALAKLRLRFGA